MARIRDALGTDTPIELVLAPSASDNSRVVNRLSPGSLVINATGLGKDAPGAPIDDSALFPENGLAWDLNYRGDLLFLDKARSQQARRGLHVEDGWTYFLHGWTQVVAEVFHVEIPTSGPGFDELSLLAAEARE